LFVSNYSYRDDRCADAREIAKWAQSSGLDLLGDGAGGAEAKDFSFWDGVNYPLRRRP
jgi:hypothetical protein